ncbi:P-loop containing nucleoside triphosphate hydrolase protein [Gloeopeniophorella convolvens]|nr:P-loop containing nucleoside triphosphate hydrolase protein [Gloeopeniophorella convolvens]
MTIKTRGGLPIAAEYLDDRVHSDVLQVGSDLWDVIAPPSILVGPIAVSVAPLQVHTGKCRRETTPPASVTCWASPSKDVQTASLGIPPDVVKQHPHIFSAVSSFKGGARTHTVATVHLIPLQEIYVQALSGAAYSDAKADLASFEDWFCQGQRILRQGSTYSIDARGGPDARTSKYRLIMTEPVLQGYAQKSQTLFTLLPPTEELPTVDGYSSPSSSSVEDDTEFDEDLEIDEGFLANSLVPQSTSATQQDGSPSVQLSQFAHEFTAEPLSTPVDPELDDHTMYVRTVDLPKIGILDGDWAIAQLSWSGNRRIVRVEANDDAVGESGTVRASPVLLHNINPEPSTPPTRLFLQAAPDGIRSRNLPTAKAVTIARVASRLSTNRTYQPLVLQGLKNFFEGKKRLIRQGDLFSVKVDLNQLQYLQAGSTGDSAEAGAPDIPEGQSTYPSSAEQVIYFTVTNVECDAPSSINTINPSNVHLGVYAGELGCWIDSAVTRMIQTGIEHTRIPDASCFLGLGGVPDSSNSAAATTERNNYRAFTQLLGLCSAALMPQALTFDIPISMLLKGSRGIGKFTTAVQIAQRLGMHVFEVNCYDFLGENDSKTEGLLRARFEQATSCSPCVLVMRHLDAFTQSTQPAEPGKDPAIVNVLKELFQDLYGSWRLTGYPILVFGTTTEPGRVPPNLVSCFKHEVDFEAPGEGERSAILKTLLAAKQLAPDVSIADLARRTAAFVAGDLASLITRTSYAAATRVTQAVGAAVAPRDVFSAGVSLTNADFERALDEARASYSQNIGAPKIPNVSWDDVGGLADVKADILDTVQLPLEHPELFASDLKKRSGILLYGPPGTGKTLLAKAVATSCALNFFSVKGPELLNMYIGESEANVRRVFQRARDARPCVVFFDELDSVAPARGAHGDSGGVMDRIVSQLLAELDGIAAGGSTGAGAGDVFVIGATNRPDLLDPALLRPGRFDRMLYLGVSDTHGAQLRILQALTRRFRLDPALDLLSVAEQCPFHFTGADFYALCADALLKAMTRKAEEIDARIATLNAEPPDPTAQRPTPLTPQYYLAEMAAPAEVAVVVGAADFAAALRELVPSVSAAEMAHYAQIRARFSAEAAAAAGEAEASPQSSPDLDGRGRGKVRAVVAEIEKDKGKGKSREPEGGGKGKGKGKAREQ